MENYLLISDAAKEVKVESHVLRYWEEELHLPIKRNELGHRYYTKEDVERFKQIKSMKERGLQLKAIKMILRDGKLDVMLQEEEKEAIRKQENESVPTGETKRTHQEGSTDRKTARDTAGQWAENRSQVERTNVVTEGMAIDIVDSRETSVVQESKEDKARRLQWLLQQLIRETLQENNKELCRDIKESVVKELDYQFRAQEEREEERQKLREQRNEEYYQKMDELLRKKTRMKKAPSEKKRGKDKVIQPEFPAEKEEMDFASLDSAAQQKPEPAKKKRHSFF